MSKYKIHRVFLNNFRNAPYNPEFCDPVLLDISSLPQETQGLFIIDDAKIIVLDGDNWYWKTSFFLALEYVLLWKIAKEEVNKSEQKWENQDSDFLRNHGSPNSPYLVSLLLTNWQESKQITRISSDKEIFLYLDRQRISEEDLTQVLMSDGLNINDFFKNYLYLPQDEVFWFLVNKSERWNLSRLLKPEKEEELLTRIYKSWEKNPTSIIRWLSVQKDKLNQKISKLKQELENETPIISSELANIKYDGRLFWNELTLINSESDIDKKLNSLNILLSKIDTYKLLSEQKQYYMYELGIQKMRKFNEIEDFIKWSEFHLFLQSYKNRWKETDKYKDIDKQISNKQEELSSGKSIETTLENIQINKINSFIFYDKSNLIEKDIQIDYEQLAYYDKGDYIKNYLETIKKLIKDKKEEIQRYGYLYTNINYIFWNVSREWFKETEVSPWKTEKFCPTCGSEFKDYEELKYEINKQLTYFEKKSKDTQLINTKIEELVLSEKFLEILNKIRNENKLLLGEKNKLVEIRASLESFNKNGYYTNGELINFVNWKNEADSKELPEKIKQYKDVIQANINMYFIDSTVEFIGIHKYLEWFKLITWNEDISTQNILDYQFMEDMSINANIQYLRSENLKFTNQKRKLEASKKRMIIDYLKKRISQIEKLDNHYRTLYNQLNENINQNIKNKINWIKIPVYIFSKRILKNYVGDAVLLDYNESTRDISIISSNFKRSPYYQYSEWQLTAVMLSILLSLNISISKITNLNLLLIDDPIQTLDDLNESSFVNLLRYQFPEKQIIISTHESDFSAYIRYKYWRLYGDKSHKNINMKDKTLLRA